MLRWLPTGLALGYCIACSTSHEGASAETGPAAAEVDAATTCDGGGPSDCPQMETDAAQSAPAACSQGEGTWLVEDVEPVNPWFGNGSIAVDAEGQPHVVFSGADFADNGVHHGYRDARGHWRIEELTAGSQNEFAVVHNAVAIGGDGGVHVLSSTNLGGHMLLSRLGADWIRRDIPDHAPQVMVAGRGGSLHLLGHQEGVLAYAHGTTESWTVQALGTAANPLEVDLAVGEQGEVSIVYSRRDAERDYSLHYGMLTDDGVFVETELDAGRVAQHGVAIALRDGQPVIAYTQMGGLFLIEPGSGMPAQRLEDGVDHGVALRADGLGGLHVAFRRDRAPHHGVLDRWSPRRLDTSPRSSDVALAVSGDGTPHLVYTTQGNILRYASCR